MDATGSALLVAAGVLLVTAFFVGLRAPRRGEQAGPAVERAQAVR